MSSILCDVVILPNQLLAESAIETSKQLQQFHSLVLLDKKSPVPHVSLYMLQLKIGDLPSAEKILSEIARTVAPPQLEAYRYDYNDGYVDVEYRRIPILDGLQQEVVKRLNPLRDGMRAKDAARLRTARDIKESNLKQYGYQSIGDLFRPHMTFTRLTSNDTNALDILDKPDRYSGYFMQLAIFEMGDNGTCVRQIASFDFLSSSPNR